ncbi:DUF983 domain-containing protein [Phaeobacter inhibens]|uniref:DUF983 domain-containing protein n=1 Tax=Phaeobacter inhibens TaxID=221822 RepID=UPI0021A3D621|nr:DUF983 domain-containing protein [Phaeobacter inhibens]UWR47030.1 DUF983 domain-containing protein [Phaeobacter inhibens]UWR90486.1 DUF983 domain-containing protein [Phaeobacter inhibens]
MTEPADQLDRDARAALRRGFRTKCPNCGEGDVLFSYLKVKDRCEVCQLDLRYARADDGPAYLTILLVGHLAGVALHVMWGIWQPSPIVTASVVSIGVIALSLWLLPRIKGALIGYQWAKRLHGF